MIMESSSGEHNIHNKFGGGKNTVSQFLDFANTRKSFASEPTNLASEIRGLPCGRTGIGQVQYFEFPYIQQAMFAPISYALIFKMCRSFNPKINDFVLNEKLY